MVSALRGEDIRIPKRLPAAIRRYWNGKFTADETELPNQEAFATEAAATAKATVPVRPRT